MERFFSAVLLYLNVLIMLVAWLAFGIDVPMLPLSRGLLPIRRRTHRPECPLNVIPTEFINARCVQIERAAVIYSALAQPAVCARAARGS